MIVPNIHNILHHPRRTTRLLWAANGLFAVGLVVILAVRLGVLFFSAPGELPRFDAVDQAAFVPLAPLPELPALPRRNPWDAGGSPWLGAQDGAANMGEIKGILLLPGVSRVLTGGGPAKTGDQLEQGKILAIERQGIRLQAAEGDKTLDLPGARRPRLKDLNTAAPTAPTTNATPQGKP